MLVRRDYCPAFRQAEGKTRLPLVSSSKPAEELTNEIVLTFFDKVLVWERTA